MAQIAATVDQLSNGRLILGVGVGSAEQEYRALGAPWEERGAVADEVLKVLQHVWTADRPNFEGKHFNFSGINSFPQPVQSPHPPFWVGGGSRRSVRRAAEFGDAWHPSRPSFQLLEEGAPRLRRLAERAGRDPGKIQIAARHPMKILDGAADSEWPLVGTESSVINGINRFATAGVSHLVMDTFYSIPELHQETVDTVLATMERFARQIIPQFPGN
jgi:alkanesulfonate monooxygenase SsuD/methylene tetrahydromethanopterin reductase-like flavin-dependent oxidoreductase (luciferase family)